MATLETTVTHRAEVDLPRRIGRRQFRRWLYQGATLLLIAAVIALAWRNLGGNLAARGLSLGFDFLGQEAGFAIGFSVIPYSSSDTYLRVFVVGVLNTILAAGLGIALATALGFLVGIARLSANWAVSRAALAYVELVRNLPLLLHVLFWYNVVLRTLPPPTRAVAVGDLVFLSNRGLYLPGVTLGDGGRAVLPAVLALLLLAAVGVLGARVRRARAAGYYPFGLTAMAVAVAAMAAAWMWGPALGLDRPRLRGFNFVGGMALQPELAALVAALAIYNASFIAELVRGSIEAVGRGQREAATALGLSRGLTLRLVVIPQALRLLVPPLTNQYLHLLKASSLATIIGYPDLINVFTGTALNQTGRAIEIVLMTMAVYLFMSAVIGLVCGVFNHMTRIVER